MIIKRKKKIITVDTNSYLLESNKYYRVLFISQGYYSLIDDSFNLTSFPSIDFEVIESSLDSIWAINQLNSKYLIDNAGTGIWFIGPEVFKELSYYYTNPYEKDKEDEILSNFLNNYPEYIRNQNIRGWYNKKIYEIESFMSIYQKYTDMSDVYPSWYQNNKAKLDRAIDFFNRNPHFYPNNNKNWHIPLQKDIDELNIFYKQWFKDKNIVHSRDKDFSYNKEKWFGDKIKQIKGWILTIENNPNLLDNQYTKIWYKSLQNRLKELT